MTDLLCPHCKTPIDEHEANRCLDGWVALSVTALELRMYPGALNPHHYPNDDWNKDYEGDMRHTRPVPEHSTDIAAAWDVVEKLISKGLFPGVGYDEETWEVWIFLDEPIEGQMGSHIKSRDPNEKLAICRAALKAVGAA